MKNYNGNIDSSNNQNILDKLVDREVVACISDMVEHLFSYDGGTYGSWDEWNNMYVNRCDECDDYFTEYDEDEDGNRICPHCGRVYKDDEEAEEEPQEIYEYWLVTNWFGEKLRNHGEPVYERWGNWIWGRCCTGQSIALDYVVAEIAADMGILEGQENDWSRK